MMRHWNLQLIRPFKINSLVLRHRRPLQNRAAREFLSPIRKKIVANPYLTSVNKFLDLALNRSQAHSDPDQMFTLTTWLPIQCFDNTEIVLNGSTDLHSNRSVNDCWWTLQKDHEERMEWQLSCKHEDRGCKQRSFDVLESCWT